MFAIDLILFFTLVGFIHLNISYKAIVLQKFNGCFIEPISLQKDFLGMRILRYTML